MIESFGALAAAVAAVMSPATSTPTPSFCQKMAAELPMKEKRVSGVRRAFDMQTMTAAQRLLLGGTISFSMKLEPIGDAPEEQQRVDAMCGASPCTIEGPVRFTLGLKNGTQHVVDAASGERARVELVGTRIRCSDL